MRKTGLVALTVIGLLVGMIQVGVVLAAEEGLVAYWNFNEGSGEVALDSVSGIQDPIENPVWVDGIEGSALDFKGAPTIFDEPRTMSVTRAAADAPDLGGAFTISVWFKAEDLQGGWIPLVDWHMWAAAPDARGVFYGHYDGEFGAHISVDGEWTDKLQYDEPVAVDEWINMVATFDGSLGKLYVNGEVVKEAALSGKWLQAVTEADLRIGRRQGEDMTVFVGIIDEVKIYNRALSDSEIVAAYNALKK